MTIPRDIGFEKDNFNKSKICNETDSLVNYIVNILLMKPGNLPGMPHIGVNLSKYIQKDMRTLDSETIKGLIVKNCEDLLPYISGDDIYVGVVNDKDLVENGDTTDEGREVLLVKIPLKVNEATRENSDKDVYYAFYRSELNELKFDFLVE